MGRYVKDLTLNKPENFVTFMMNDYLQKNRFSMSEWKGTPAYRAGDAMMEGYKYLNWSYNGSVLHIEAWMKGTFGGEMGLEGFVGCLQKKPYKESLEALYTALQQDIPAGKEVFTGEGEQPFVQTVPVQTVDNTGAANQALLLGILTLILAFIWPLMSIIVACLAFNRARLGSGSSKANLAGIGKVLSIIGMIIAIVLWVLNIIAVFA